MPQSGPPPTPAASSSPLFHGGPSESHAERLSGAWAYNARIGLVLFFLYFALYAGFIGLAAFDLDALRQPVVAGVNLAIVYGFMLILSAFVLAVIYMFLCKAEPVDPNRPALSEAEIAEKAQSEEGSA